MAQIILDSNNNLIQGDFDNATINNRTKFKTTTTNATTNVYAVPNGSATSAGFTVTNAADPTNASKLTIATNGSTDTQIISGVNGSGTYLPLSFYTNNALAAQISTAGVFSATGGIARSSMPVGSVLQVVSTQITAKTTVSVATAGTFYDVSGFSVSITPTNANSKIMFLAMVNQSSQTTGANRQYLRIVRDSTAIGIGDVAGSQYRTTTAFFINDGNAIGTLPLIWLDSPNTTSSTTYKLQVTSNGGSQTACFNRTSGDSQNDSAVTASQILVLEIAA